MLLAIGGAFLLHPPLTHSTSGLETVVGALMVMAAMVVGVVAPLTMVRSRRKNSRRIASAVAVPIAAWIGRAAFLGILSP